MVDKTALSEGKRRNHLEKALKADIGIRVVGLPGDVPEIFRTIRKLQKWQDEQRKK